MMVSETGLEDHPLEEAVAQGRAYVRYGILPDGFNEKALIDRLTTRLSVAVARLAEQQISTSEGKEPTNGKSKDDLHLDPDPDIDRHGS